MIGVISLINYSSNSIQFIFERTFLRSSLALSRCLESEKIVVTRKKFSANNENSPSTLEYKKASSVMKKLNWENKKLFGPVQSYKGDKYDKTKIAESDQIIQHRTQIPVMEPLTNIVNNIRFSDQTISELDIILEFPLMNKAQCKCSELKEKINKLNYLKKYLESMVEKSTIPSVSVILEKTMPAERVEILEFWKSDMVKKLGEEGFRKYKAELFDNGTTLHNIINNFLASTPESELVIEERNRGHWKSLKSVLPYISDVKLLEEQVLHPFLQYRGVIDCFAKYKNHLVVIDWKTSKKFKLSLKSTYDNPLQIAAYVGALNFDPKFQYLARKGLIVVAYENGSPATKHFIDECVMLEYWNEWLNRVKLFWEMQMMAKSKLS